MIPSPPYPFRLRPMRLSDIDDVMSIERASFPSSWSAAGYRHELTANPQARYVVLEVDQSAESGATRGGLIGYAGYWIVANEAHVSTIAIAPAWRRKGLGAVLLLCMVYDALAHNASVVSLEVRAHNEAAQKLYAEYGFLAVGRRHRYYRDTGEDAVLMDLDLTRQSVKEMLESKRVALWERLRGGSH